MPPSRGFDTRLCAQRELGDRALGFGCGAPAWQSRRTSAHSMGPLERITVAEEVEDGWERRGGAAVLGVGEGDVTDAGAAAAPVPSEGSPPRQMIP